MIEEENQKDKQIITDETDIDPELVAKNTLELNINKFFDELNDTATGFEKQIKNAKGDLFQVLFGKKVQWLLECPIEELSDFKKENLMNAILNYLEIILPQRTGVTIAKRKVNVSQVVLQLANKNGVFCAWDVYHNKVQVKNWDKLIDLYTKLNFAQEKCQHTQQELVNNKKALKNKESLLDNGLYWAYIKRTFNNRKFKKEAKILLDNNQQTLDFEKAVIRNIQNEIQIVKEQIQVDEISLKKLKEFTTAFPYGVSYTHYDEYKLDKNYQEYYSIQDFAPNIM